MAFLGTEIVRKLIKSDKIIENGDSRRVVCGAYELSLGGEVFITDSKEKKKQFLSNPKEQITINPGQFALLLTEEKVNIPINKIAFISIKAGIKLKGLINVSGFHVDPGFKGQLVFSVYNAGTSPISLVKGEPSFLIWFADLELTADEKTSYDTESHEHKNQDSIPVKYIDALLGGELASPSVLLNKINENKAALENRVNVLERDQKANNYLKVTIIGAIIALVVRFGFDFVALGIGYNKARDINQREIKFMHKEMCMDSIINKQLLEKKTLILEIDSLRKIKNSESITKGKKNGS
jgi:dCTP deaminase